MDHKSQFHNAEIHNAENRKCTMNIMGIACKYCDAEVFHNALHYEMYCTMNIMGNPYKHWDTRIVHNAGFSLYINI